MLRQGVLLDVHGFAIRESGNAATHTSGTGASGTTDNAGYAVGVTTITLASAGTGTILVGDIISFAGSSADYVVVTGDSDISGGGTVVIASPGLIQAIPAATTAYTLSGVGAVYQANMGFARTAIVLANRLPALPEEGDSAVDRIIVTDPRSGISFELAMYKEYRQVHYELSAAWGVKMVKPEHTCILQG
jgi:hypothetical protein